jgi:hypothetical protein
VAKDIPDGLHAHSALEQAHGKAVSQPVNVVVYEAKAGFACALLE